MIEVNNSHNTRQRAVAQAQRLRWWALRHPWAALALLLGAGMLCGATMRSVIGMAQVEALQTSDASRQAELEQVRRDAQREVVRELAIGGCGIALRSLWDVAGELDSGALVRVLPAYQGSQAVGIFAVHAPMPVVPVSLAAIIAHLRRHLAGTGHLP